MTTSSPHTGPSVNGNSSEPVVDPQALDELAAMFLTDPDTQDVSSQTSPTADASRADKTVRRERLIVGHLPVRAGVWLTPYAAVRAKQAGSAALLRVAGDGSSSVELFGATPPAVAPGPATVREAINFIAPFVNQWIVYSAQQDLQPADEIIAADQVTILSSADDAAVVAAYQQIKAYVDAHQSAPDASSANDSVENAPDVDATQGASRRSLPRFALAVLGAAEDRARATIDRLNRTTQQFLDTSVETAVIMPRIDSSAHATATWRFAADAPCTPSTIWRWLADAPEYDAARTTVLQHRLRLTETPGEVRQPAAETDRAQPKTRQQAHTSATQSARTASPARADDDAPFESTAQRLTREARQHRRVKVVPKPVADMEFKSPAPHVTHETRTVLPERPDSLASQVDAVTALPVRCPNHEHVELAVDQTGRLHLLGLEHTLRDMLHVEPWAKAHHELINMACPNSGFDANKTPQHHIFTDEPIKLADLHGTNLHLHVLTAIEINGQRGWYSAPLSAG